MNKKGVAVFNTTKIQGEVVITDLPGNKIQLSAHFTKLPKGKHGFHIHRAGDLRGEGCLGLCEHYDTGRPKQHGAEPSRTNRRDRHTGDLGNIEIPKDKKEFRKTYIIHNTSVRDLWGRSIIVHEDEDDLGLGPHEDSKTTGHSGKRIGCAIFGRVVCKTKTLKNKTKKNITRRAKKIFY
jgi:Cu-Zn family superoxide dismutase